MDGRGPRKTYEIQSRSSKTGERVKFTRTVTARTGPGRRLGGASGLLKIMDYGNRSADSAQAETFKLAKVHPIQLIVICKKHSIFFFITLLLLCD
jgi:hypothetical protein